MIIKHLLGPTSCQRWRGVRPASEAAPVGVPNTLGGFLQLFLHHRQQIKKSRIDIISSEFLRPSQTLSDNTVNLGGPVGFGGSLQVPRGDSVSTSTFSVDVDSDISFSGSTSSEIA